MKSSLLTLLLLWASTAHAGGEAVQGMVTSYSSSGGIYSFHFIQTDGEVDMIRGCKEFDVQVRYQRVPWYSWLPFVKTTHPSHKESEAAVAQIIKAQHKKTPIKFGYIGGGLVETSRMCALESKGLLLYGDTVLSFNTPV